MESVEKVKAIIEQVVESGDWELLERIEQLFINELERRKARGE